MSTPSGLVKPESADGLDQRLRREGWSLHQRLKVAPQHEEAGASKRAEAALQRWREQVGPDQPQNFEKRLRWDGLTEANLAWVLDPPAEATPLEASWWPLLQELRQAARLAAATPGQAPLAERGKNQPFVHVWRPAAARMLLVLQQRCGDLEPRLQLAEGAWHDLGEALLTRLCTTTDQALWELFNQRRTPGQMLLAHLGSSGDGSGEPVHEAYNALVGALLESGYGLLLGEFPVLGRLLAVVCCLWLEGSEEMLRRVADSRAELESQFAIDPVLPLEAIQLGLSDPHRGGRAVAILLFSHSPGGDGCRVVYKPKDMGVDATFQHLLQSLNKNSELSPLRCLTVLNRDSYGFMEWVEHRPCGTEAELAQFYGNAGRMLALLHLLGCTDCHHENLIACDEQLMLIDTETLLEADLRDLISDQGDDPDAISALQTSMQGSVLRSGLLPHWLMAGAGRKQAYDVSALGIQPPPQEREQPGWLGLNSDGMMAGRVTQPCALPTSLPIGLGRPQRLTDFVEELCAGFESQLREVIRLRPLLQEALKAFHSNPRRLVARNTRLYFKIQRQMLEPAALRSAIAHGLKLEQLSRTFVLASEKPRNWLMFEAEVRQMERLDIPFFEHLIDEESLPLPEGLPSIEGFMKSSGLAAAQRRLADLDASEINFQQQLVRGAIAARHMVTHTGQMSARISTESADRDEHEQPLEADNYALEASQLSEELWDAAIRNRKGRPEWLGMDLGADGESFHFGLIGQSLYSGASGIALAFARNALGQPAAAATNWKERAWSCMQGLIDLADRNNNNELFRFVRDLPYGLSGSGGLLLAMGLLEEAGIAAARKLGHQLRDQLRPERLLTDEGIDMISGVAGLIGPLLRSGDLQAQELAFACGERLMALQIEAGGWLIGREKAALTGFSHGAAGMAAALARLAQASGDERFAEAAQRAVAYERSVYSAEQGNWPDFRSSNEPTQFMISWCHGAPGILLSRLVLQDAGLVDEHTAAELETARACTLARLKRMVVQRSDEAAHLCCGVFGLTGLLRLDAALCNQPLPELVAHAERKVIDAAKARAEYSSFSVEHSSINLPGLFTGKAGVTLVMQEVAYGLKWLGPVLSTGLLA